MELLDEVEVETLPLELVDVDVETLPLDDEDVDVDTFPLDEDVLLTLPLEVEVDEVLLTPPVEVDVEEPPLDVEVEEPPVDEDVEEPPEPPEEVELEVDPPLDVDEMTMLPDDPPPLPPKNPPAKKPPPPNPPPQPPPITAGGELPVLASIGAAGTGTGICSAGSETIIGSHAGTTGAGRTRVRAATRSTGRFTGFFTTFFLLNWVRGLAVSATCTAPPPISAPPAAQAASFAMAIRTDIIVSLPLGDRFRALFAFDRQRQSKG